MVRPCVQSRNLVNEEALAQWGLLQQKQRKKIKSISPLFVHAHLHLNELKSTLIFSKAPTV